MEVVALSAGAALVVVPLPAEFLGRVLGDHWIGPLAVLTVLVARTLAFRIGEARAGRVRTALAHPVASVIGRLVQSRGFRNLGLPPRSEIGTDGVWSSDTISFVSSSSCRTRVVSEPGKEAWFALHHD